MAEADTTATDSADGRDRPSGSEGQGEVGQRIGRYRVQRLLGEGGFGLVYLALDEQLQRLVAIKLPHRQLVPIAEDAEAYLAEARAVATLDHPNIVPVYDVGSTADCPCFIVSKYIEGSTLSHRLRTDRPSITEATEIVATVAEALHHAHQQGLVHRDIKPGNILLDRAGRAYVADFGLALREHDLGKGPQYAGTPAYMSPEQARGEGHRVDGRSDIFSLGVVYYELLTGQRPFQAVTRAELREQIQHQEIRPPRYWDASIPKELERICLKALSKRASERYSSAREMADDLRYFFQQSTEDERDGPPSKLSAIALSSVSATTPVVLPPPPETSSQPVKIVPKGLRAFDAHDANFFLELLPGPRDRDGLPESLRFWKTRIEELNPDHTFSVGLCYGPSGCGKTSIMRAGLLPRLASHVRAVYLEASAHETEERLLKALARLLPAPANFGLVETLAALRQGQLLGPQQKVLLVLDQFEQWLHAAPTEPIPELVQALRQCDGGRLQSIIMVRDDFGMAATRFMAALDIPIVQGKNFATVDRFDPLHARKILAAFGRAYGRLPESTSQVTKEQDSFLEQAVASLAPDGKIVPVRLALFADMVKGKPWTPATLKEVGGTEGVGVTFLEETFAVSTAPPQHRLHRQAAEGVLKALLPEPGTDLKGHRRSRQELLEASGYAHRPRAFDELLQMLDGELRLITPTDPEGRDESVTEVNPPAAKYYQLTHDYLVPPLREWLTRKQKETRRGRAELALADQALVWQSRPENRHLPSLWQWCSIRCLVTPARWTHPQRAMMRRAAWVHACRGLVLAAVLLVLGGAGYEWHGRQQARILYDRILEANTEDVPNILNAAIPYRHWLKPLLADSDLQSANTHDRRKHLHLLLAAASLDASRVPDLLPELSQADPIETRAIRDVLEAYQAEWTPRLWQEIQLPINQTAERRLPRAAVLAYYDPQSPHWQQVRRPIAEDMVVVPVVALSGWMKSLQPVAHDLLEPLAAIYRDRTPKKVAERSLATSILATYAADDPPFLSDLLLDADEQQFRVLFPPLKERLGKEQPALLTQSIRTEPPKASSDADREQWANRQANAAVALLKLDETAEVWPLLRHQPDPRARTHLIHRLASLGVNPTILIHRLANETDLSIRQALILSLGEYAEPQLSQAGRQSLLPALEKAYQTEADPGLHAAVEWLLRTWDRGTWIQQVNESWAKLPAPKDRGFRQIPDPAGKAPANHDRQWYINGQGQMMVVLPGPIEFWMGSPSTERDRFPNEIRHFRLIPRTIAIAAKPVTLAQYRQFDPGYKARPVDQRLPNLPVVNLDWHRAAAYCNWLSAQEGLPPSEWCYQEFYDPAARGAGFVGMALGTGPLGTVAALCLERPDSEYRPLMKPTPDSLSRRGYRLPTEAEMEYATRAGTTTSRFFGETDEWLSAYAWYTKNSHDLTWPVGSLKPNDFGLFDTLGNAWTWCHNPYRDDPADREGATVVDEDERPGSFQPPDRALRGSSAGSMALALRSANRFHYPPTLRSAHVGMRPARTISIASPKSR